MTDDWMSIQKKKAPVLSRLPHPYRQKKREKERRGEKGVSKHTSIQMNRKGNANDMSDGFEIRNTCGKEVWMDTCEKEEKKAQR
jgi:hypothetical protein